MVAVDPRSTCSHWGSLNALDHRVPVLPSTAALAGVPAFSTEEAVAGLPCDSRVAAAWAVPTAIASEASRIRISAPARTSLRVFRARRSGTVTTETMTLPHGTVWDGRKSALRLRDSRCHRTLSRLP